MIFSKVLGLLSLGLLLWGGQFPLSHPQSTPETKDLITPRAAAEEVFKDAAKDPFLQHLENQANTSYTDITSSVLNSVTNRRTLFNNKKTYSAVRRYYDRCVRAFSREYPARTFETEADSVFSSYPGNAKFSFPEVHRFPMFPISFLIHDDDSIKLNKTIVKYQGKDIYGLEVNTRIAPKYNNKPALLLIDLSYLPTVNARALGFKHGQLIPQLSKNVKPGLKFNYNGLRDWSQHQRYAKDDQVSRPIELTNFAHLIGSDIYTVSVHPDFALSFPNLAKPQAKMVFFLWKDKPLSGQTPDFIFTVELNP